MVVYLVLRLEEIPADDFYGIWVRIIIVIDVLSLVLDAVGVVQYFTDNKGVPHAGELEG